MLIICLILESPQHYRNNKIIKEFTNCKSYNGFNQRNHTDTIRK